MKKIFLVALVLMSTSVFAQYVNTNWQYNTSVCIAKTICPNGAEIWCKTIGFNYGNAPRTLNNMCRTRVIPGQFVQCQGFSDQVDAWGRVVFVPANLPVSCF